MSNLPDDEWTAVREFRDPETGALVAKAWLGKPERLQEGAVETWLCKFHVDGIERPDLSRGYGIDSFSALFNALEGIARVVRESGKKLSWAGGEVPGDSGFRRQIPTALGAEFASRIEALIEREVEEHVKRLKEKSEARGKPA